MKKLKTISQIKEEWFENKGMCKINSKNDIHFWNKDNIYKGVIVYKMYEFFGNMIDVELICKMNESYDEMYKYKCIKNQLTWMFKEEWFEEEWLEKIDNKMFKL